MPKFDIPSHDKDSEESDLDAQFQENPSEEAKEYPNKETSIKSNNQGQDPNKPFDLNKDQVVPGSPKHPFLSENPF